MAQDHTDAILVEIASKLQLKPAVHSSFFNSTLQYLTAQYQKAFPNLHTSKFNEANTTTPLLDVQRNALVENATTTFLNEQRMRLWPSYVADRSHLTIRSPYGDNAKVLNKQIRAYKRELKEFQDGKRTKRPTKPRDTKGLTFLRDGQKIKRLVPEYMARLVEVRYLQLEMKRSP